MHRVVERSLSVHPRFRAPHASDWSPVTLDDDTASAPTAARVILLAGPSGSGKTSLARRSGLPVLNLDDFYKPADHPDLPLLPHGGTDWDSPGSWDADAALGAIDALARTGRAQVPVYDIATSSIAGSTAFELGGARLFVAEGIFAAEIVGRCREHGVLADAICLRGRPSVTAWRRLRRDLREGRKSLPYLVRRGWRLMRAERGIVVRQTQLGAAPCGHGEALERVHAAGTPAPPAPRSPHRELDPQQG
jgi:uridine kinase